MSERAIDVAGVDDEPLLPVQRLVRRKGKGLGGPASAWGNLTREERELQAAAEPSPVPRPLTRADCENGERPCPWVACSHHLYLDVSESDSIKFNFPLLEPWELEETCALDVAARGGETLDGVGALLNLTRERVRQVEEKACASLKRSANDTGL